MDGTAMSILPVLDLMQGQIVRGLAGKRAEYRPIVSKLVDSAQPLAVAQALRQQFGFSEFYLADLDAIRGGPPDLATYQQLQDAGFRLWIDAGLHTHKDRTLKLLIVANVAGIVVGPGKHRGHSRRTWEARSRRRVGPERVIFSRSICSAEAHWATLRRGGPTIRSRLRPAAVRKIGGARLIVLDLARVGVGRGIGTGELCARLKRRVPGGAAHRRRRRAPSMEEGAPAWA